MAKPKKNKRPKGKKTPLGVIKQAIKKAAAQYKVKPYQVNKVQFWEHVYANSYGIKEWDLRQIGGFEALRNQLFPTPDTKDELPPNPLASDAASKLDGHELSDYIAAVIGECAEEIGIPAYELTWCEFRRYIKHQWGENDAGIARYNITRAGGFNAIRDAYFPIEPSGNIVDKRRLVEHANLNRRLGKAYADEKFFLDSTEEWAKRCFDGKIKPAPVPKGSKIIDRVVSLLLSDLHIGSDVRAEETGYQNFGVIEESRRLAALTKQTNSYKPQYRERSRLVVHMIGDIIQGILHDARDGAVEAEQFARALHILSQMIGQFSAAWPQVDIYCATGNHGRNKNRHHERAVQQKWDSVETKLYVALSYACSQLKNVRFHIPKTPFCKIDILGHKVFTTHGDNVLKPGNPGKAINMSGLETQINKINNSLPDAEKFSVVACGHVHTPTVTMLPNGTFMVTNGCMVPVDQFAVSIGELENHCAQWLWESVKGHAFGDSRLIKVGKQHDQDASLDNIIKPWTGLPG